MDVSRAGVQRQTVNVRIRSVQRQTVKHVKSLGPGRETTIVVVVVVALLFFLFKNIYTIQQTH